MLKLHVCHVSEIHSTRLRRYTTKLGRNITADLCLDCTGRVTEYSDEGHGTGSGNGAGSIECQMSRATMLKNYLTMHESPGTDDGFPINAPNSRLAGDKSADPTLVLEEKDNQLVQPQGRQGNWGFIVDEFMQVEYVLLPVNL